jgi:hypothetical protein
MYKYFETYRDAMEYRKNNSLTTKPIKTDVWCMGSWDKVWTIILVDY